MLTPKPLSPMPIFYGYRIWLENLFCDGNREWYENKYGLILNMTDYACFFE
jgi:hypothetical protein